MKKKLILSMLCLLLTACSMPGLGGNTDTQIVIAKLEIQAKDKYFLKLFQR